MKIIWGYTENIWGAGTLLWLSCIVYMIPLKKRENYKLALGFMGVISIILGSLLGSSIHVKVWAGIIYYLYAVLVFRICTDLKRFGIWYCGVWAILTQQFIMEIGIKIIKLWNIRMPVLGEKGILIGIIIIGYLIIGVTIARWMPDKNQYQIGPRQMISAWLLSILFETLLVMESVYDGNEAMNIMAQFYCLTLLYLQNVLFKKSSMSQELDTIQLLWHQQKEQYRISKETIQLINHKCHDLKHQMKAMYSLHDDKVQEEYLKEIEDSIQIYSAIVKTGNEILDVILTEKSLFCEKNGIHINCVANGQLLSFIGSVDLYTMFGNALDNAIESVSRIQEKEKRLIDIMIYAKQKFLVIQIVNPLVGSLKFEDDLPITTKAKNGYHGYGLKSIRHTIQKYGGYLTVEVKKGCFYLKMMAPLPEEVNLH